MKIKCSSVRLMAFSMMLLNVFYIFGISDADSLRQQIPEMEGIELLNAYNDLSSNFREKDSEQSLVYTNKLLSYLRTSKCPHLDRDLLLKYLVESYYNKGYCLIQQEDYYGGIENLYRALIKTEDRELSAEIHYLIGDSYQYLGNNEDALENYIKGMDFLESGLREPLYFKLLLKKAQVLFNTGDFENSLNTYMELLASEENTIMESGNAIKLADIYLNIGIIYKEMKQPDTAMNYFNQGQQFQGSDADNIAEAIIYNQMGDLEAEADFKKALEYYKKALSIITGMENDVLIAVILNNIVSIYIRYPDESNLTEAIVYAESALMKAEKTADLNLMTDCYLNYSEIYKLQRNHQSSYRMLNKYYTIKDSILLEDYLRNIKKTEALIDHKSRLGQILLSEKTFYKEELQLRKKRSLNLILVILMIPLASVSIFLLISYRSKERYLHKLKHINQSISNLTTQLQLRIKELDEFKSSLKDQYEQAIAEVRRKDNILIIQSRYVALSDMLENISIQWKSNLNQISILVKQAYSQFQSESLSKDGLEKIVRGSMTILQIMSQKIDDFRDFFRPHSNPAHFKVRDIILSVIDFVEEYYRNSNIKIERNELSEELVVEGYPNEFALIILNILNNSREAFLRANQPEARISITAKEGLNRIMIEIRDNAGGVDQEILPKIFEPFVTEKSGKAAGGLGLYIVREIVETRYNGKITLMNENGGVLVKIIF